MINDFTYAGIAVKNEKNMYIELTDAVVERYKEKNKTSFCNCWKER